MRFLRKVNPSNDDRCFPKLHNHTSDLRYFYVLLEYIPGRDLHAAIESRSPVVFGSASTLVTFFKRLFDCVGVMHSRRVVHADLKPANVMLREDGSPVIIDFDDAVDDRHKASFRGTKFYIDPALIDEQFSKP